MNICLKAENHTGTINGPVMVKNKKKQFVHGVKLCWVCHFHPNQATDLPFNCNHHFQQLFNDTFWSKVITFKKIN